MDVGKEAAALDKKARDLLKSLYTGLTPWRKCQVARHPERPNCTDYIDALFTDKAPPEALASLIAGAGGEIHVAAQAASRRASSERAILVEPR